MTVKDLLNPNKTPPGPLADHMLDALVWIRRARLTMTQATVLVFCAKEAKAFTIAEIEQGTGLHWRTVRRRGEELAERKLLKRTTREEPKKLLAFHVTNGGVEKAKQMLGIKI